MLTKVFRILTILVILSMLVPQPGTVSAAPLFWETCTYHGTVSYQGAGGNWVAAEGIKIWDEWNQEVVATTGSDGTYSYNQPAGKFVQIQVDPALLVESIYPGPRVVIFDEIIEGCKGPFESYDFFITYPPITVSGTITSSGNPLTGVSVAFNRATTITLEDGTYSFDHVPTNVNSSIVPTLAGYTFSPEPIAVNGLTDNLSGQDFTGKNTYIVSGTITKNGTGLDGVSVAFNGGTTTTHDGGIYSFDKVPVDVNSSIVPTLTGYIFSPEPIAVNGLTGDLSGQDFTAMNIYTVSGVIIRNLDDTGLDGVSVAFNGGTTTTHDGGIFSFDNVPANVNSSVVPTLTGYIFNPTGILVDGLIGNKTDVYFTAILQHYTVSGTITKNGTGLDGVSVAFNGGTTTTHDGGIYSFDNVPADVNSSIVPTLTGYIFSPEPIAVNGLTGDLSGQDFTAKNLFTIAGYVRDGDFFGVSGVTVALTDFAPVTTNARGYFEFVNVPIGFEGTLTASKAHWTFDPGTMDIGPVVGDNEDANFTGSIETHNVRGKVVDEDGTGMPGLRVSFYGTDAYTDANGEYEFLNFPYNVSSDIRPIDPRYGYTPKAVYINGLTEDRYDTFVAVKIVAILNGKISVEGVAVSNATVTINEVDSEDPYQVIGTVGSATTKADGKYVVKCPVNTLFTTAVSHPYFTFDKFTFWDGESFSTCTTNQIMNWTSASVQVKGYVTFNGTPFSGPFLNAETASTRAGEEGFYNLRVKDTDVANLRYFKVTPSLPGYQFTPAYRIITPSTGIIDKNFVATLRNYKVSGTVLLNGKPMPYIEVTMGNRKTKTDAYGKYSFVVPFGSVVNPKAWKYGFSFENPAFFNMPATNMTANNIIATKLDTPRSLSGKITVVNKADAPLASALVTLKYGTHVLKQIRTNAAGEYNFSSLVAGSGYSVEASLPNYSFTTLTGSDVNLTDDDGTADFEATRVAPIRGTMYGLKPGTEMQINVEGPEGFTKTYDVTLKSYSRYDLPALPVGEYTITPVLAGYTFTPKPATAKITLTTVNVTLLFHAAVVPH